MANEVPYPAISAVADQEASPRSTILGTSGRMTTVLPGIKMNNDAAAVVVSTEGTTKEGKILATPPKNKDGLVSGSSTTPGEDIQNGGAKSSAGGPKRLQQQQQQGGLERESREGSPPTPISHHHNPEYHHYSTATTPSRLQQQQQQQQQQGSGYYMGYATTANHQHHHMIQEPASPALTAGGYDVVSFFQPHIGGGTDFHIPVAAANSFGGNATTTLSPLRGVPTVTMIGSIPPPSPLFPRLSTSTSGGMDAGQQHLLRGGVPPSLPYMATLQLGASAGGGGGGNSNSNYAATYPLNGAPSHSSEEGAWNAMGDTRNPNGYALSPQIGSLGMQMLYGVPRSTSGGRAYSFDESMLPPAVLDDPGNPSYSPYGGSQSSLGGATLFAHQASWNYGGPPDPYAPPSSPLQPRPTTQIGMYAPQSPGGDGGIRGSMSPYGQFFPASSPGPPIQTTPSNKGPDGANLFIFHIPNHFTNLDMYQLFSPYGNLLSVRIMVERDSGRSRGFGFVSFDTQEAAALAIKELNGFPIGNKRLKVQHKQIRRQDLDQDLMHDGFEGSYPQFPSLPPSGANVNQHLWFDTAHNGEQDDDEDENGQRHLMPEQELGEQDPNPRRVETSVELDADSNDQVSPLATLGQLQSALPDITGSITTE